MDVRIGFAQSNQVLEIELDDDTDREALKADVEKALSGGALWLTDRKGKEYGLAADRIAFVELGSTDAARRIGFGA